MVLMLCCIFVFLIWLCRGRSLIWMVCMYGVGCLSLLVLMMC